MHADADSMLDTIAELAEQIARGCPDCADAASRIARLVLDIRGAGFEAGAVRDAIETGTVDSDLTEAELDATVEAVRRGSRDAK